MKRNIFFKIYVNRFNIINGESVTRKLALKVGKRYVDKYFRAGGNISISFLSSEGTKQKDKLDIIMHLKRKINFETELYNYVNLTYPEFLV